MGEVIPDIKKAAMLLLVIGILLFVFSFVTNKKFKPIYGVLLIFIIMGFQSNVLSDYQNYLDAYTYCQTTGKLDVRTSTDEPLWAALFFGFSQILPFWFFILFLCAIQCYILYIFIRKYCKNSYMWLTTVLFYFTFNMMLLQMYVIRQSFAISIVLLAFILIDKKKNLLLPLLTMALAYLIHNSSIIALPFLFLYYFYGKKDASIDIYGTFGKVGLRPFVVTGAFLVLYVVKDRFLNDYIMPLSLAMGDDFRLAGYLDSNAANGMSNEFTISPLIALYDAIIVFLVSWFLCDSNKKMKVFGVISIVVAFGDMMLFGIGSIPRILMCLVIFNLPVYTAMVTQIRKQFGGIWSLLLVALLIGYAVKTSLPWFLGTDGDQFGNYKFIFIP